MRHYRWNRPAAALAGAGLAAGPVLRLAAAQHSITLDSFGGQVYLDPGIWVEAFDVTHVPNGTYYIEVTANPQRVLHETTTRNDVSVRKVILGGTAGHRTVKVPAWHGIDPGH